MMTKSIATPAISVIIPVYNTEKYLPECIESILGQTLTNFELIIVDDHSTDSSHTICRQYADADARISLNVNPKKGVSSARNFAITQAQGRSNIKKAPKVLGAFFM